MRDQEAVIVRRDNAGASPDPFIGSFDGKHEVYLGGRVWGLLFGENLADLPRVQTALFLEIKNEPRFALLMALQELRSLSLNARDPPELSKAVQRLLVRPESLSNAVKRSIRHL